VAFYNNRRSQRAYVAPTQVAGLFGAAGEKELALDWLEKDHQQRDTQMVRPSRVVKIFKCVEGSRSSMMDVEDEHNHMRAAFGLRYWFGQPATPAAE